MKRHLIILLSLLLVISPVTAAFSAEASHDRTAMTDMNGVSDCVHGEQDKTEKSCCQDAQCNKNCKTMQCHNAGKLSALSISIGTSAMATNLRLNSIWQSHEPGNGHFNTLLRPPIAHL